MQTRIEPPILMSRILTFVFATMVVVMGIMGWTLYKIFPLDRPQVFFLKTVPTTNIDVTLNELPPNDDFFEEYTQNFVREYIRARNEITADRGAMRTKWNNGVDGLVRLWSSDAVYADFIKTGMWNAIMSDNVPERAFECNVEFRRDNVEMARMADGSYSVKFRYFCGDGIERVQSDYTINVKLDVTAPAEIHWADRRGNPLGIRVVGYKIESDNGDPLDVQHLVGATPAQ